MQVVDVDEFERMDTVSQQVVMVVRRREESSRCAKRDEDYAKTHSFHGGLAAESSRGRDHDWRLQLMARGRA